MYLSKDFIETSEGLVFAVVENGTEQGKVLCFLRYIFHNGCWKKVNTEEANQLLVDNYPHYLYFSAIKDVQLHAVKLDAIYKHHQPKKRLKSLITNKIKSGVEGDLLTLYFLFEQMGFDCSKMGVTGSILIGAQRQSSDIDFVFYSRKSFNQAREIIKKLIQQGDCSELSVAQWLESYHRRACQLGFDEYLWHEKRKYNKAIINQRKFDLSLVVKTIQFTQPRYYKKLQSIVLDAQVIDDSLAFDYPAEFMINHKQVTSVVSYTATYTGQAKKGEWVEVSGMLEQADDGIKRIIVGSTREAKEEYIKVIHE